MTPQRSQEQSKRAAAARAVEEIENDMIIGLGSGSTTAFAIEALAARVANGLRVVGIPTSEKTATLARRLAVPLTTFAEHRRIDVAILREKIVAGVSDRMVVIVDETKLTDHLGGGTPLPVEIVSFGWQIVLDRLAAIGCAPRIRLAEGKPFATDGGNYIADCTIAELSDPASLEARLSAIVGVVESGLFIGMASQVVVGRSTGVEVMER
jgi:ribose 5-phosphate isomerase A